MLAALISLIADVKLKLEQQIACFVFNSIKFSQFIYICLREIKIS